MVVFANGLIELTSGLLIDGATGHRYRVIAGGGGGSGPHLNGNPSQTVTQTGDPSLAELNKYMTGQIKGAAGQYGGLSGLIAPRSYNMMDYGNSSGPEHAALGSYANYLQGPLANSTEAAGLNQMALAADPTNRLAAANDYFSNIAGPSIANKYTAMGQGRSGAMGEAMAMGGSNMAVPIANDVARAQQAYGGTLTNFGQLLNQREGQRLGDLINVAGAPRMDQAASNNMGMDTLLSALLRFPVNSGAGVSNSSQFIPPVRGGEPPVWQQVMGGVGSAAGLISMLGMMCWVAEALYGPTDPRFYAAFWQVNFGPRSWRRSLGRALYRRFGRMIASSPLALRLVRPIFDRVARAGARNLKELISRG